MPNTPPNLIARGNISASRFVKLDTATNFGVVQATANSKNIGVIYEGTNQAPLSDIVTTDYAAKSGQEIRLYGDGDVCSVIAGAAVTAGDLVKSDANGYAVTTAVTGTTVQWVSGIALEAATAAGQELRIQVKNFPYLPSAT
jgi:hypothetical protein